MQLLDQSGVPLTSPPPKPGTGEYYRSAYGMFRVICPFTGAETMELGRAQIPYVVTVLTLSSRFQMVADRREYFVYAPPDVKSAVGFAWKLWKRWERGPRDLSLSIEDDYPKVQDACVAEPIDDACFAEMWKSARSRKHKFNGHPEDPFAFTCLDPDVMLFKTTDFQQDLIVTV